ncbi:hypothetical protein FHK92_17520 [Pseudomonas brassicacearum subsp. neoaurantiaca]|uniref:Uncharacterized protein n=1 Tax=Pseudomonas brassicacearum subsp. neoaurantiaca TaxID=494916 RepID=A0A7V8UDJ3_9PSED|nr:hypothetical protein [Pseudomonas brassicacearum subsp. neoaurantiaca]
MRWRQSKPSYKALVARELAPAGERSSPKTNHADPADTAPSGFGAASQPSGSKLPRHVGSPDTLAPNPIP